MFNLLESSPPRFKNDLVTNISQYSLFHLYWKSIVKILYYCRVFSVRFSSLITSNKRWVGCNLLRSVFQKTHLARVVSEEITLQITGSVCHASLLTKSMAYWMRCIFVLIVPTHAHKHTHTHTHHTYLHTHAHAHAHAHPDTHALTQPSVFLILIKLIPIMCLFVSLQLLSSCVVFHSNLFL